MKTEERFWAKVKKTDGCWLWVGAINAHGYGNFNVGNKTHVAHRFMWFLIHDFIPDQLCVLHTCDVRHCVNPGHLWLGTKRDNALDMIAKGRMSMKRANGEDHHQVKLTAAKVEAIRANIVLPREQLAAKYDVCLATISHILNHRTWRNT